MNATETKQVRQAVNAFFGKLRYVYATPDTPNHSANFYGDTRICRLNRRDVIGCIDAAYGNWNDENGDMDIEDCITTVLDDLQHDRPDKN